MCKENSNPSPSMDNPHTICMPHSSVVNRLEEMEMHHEIVKDGSPPCLPPSKPRVALDAGSSCPVCGDDMVAVRGKHPNSSKRVVCPACLADWVDMIRETVNRKK